MRFHKIKTVSALPDMRLSVQFANGVTKLYDVKACEERLSAFAEHLSPRLLEAVTVNEDCDGIVWSDGIEISCDELWDNGREIKTPFDGLMSFADASELWGLSESTLRKAVSYGKIVAGVDARKYGKQWIITYDAMIREYGEPLTRRRKS